MAWKQVLQPNLDDPSDPLYVYIGGQIATDWYGWCLAVTAASFGAVGSSYSAKTAWNSCPTKHRDYDIPEGLWIPLWYEGGEYGHVCQGYRTGDTLMVYSSPYTHKATFDIFKGNVKDILEYIGKVYGVGGFSGWSETLLDSRVIEQVTQSKPKPKPEPTPEPPEDNNGKDNDMDNPEPVTPIDQQLAGGLIEEAGSIFNFSDKTKMIAYIIGDFFLCAAIVLPDIINTIQAPNLTIFGEYLAKVLLETGTCILMVFKLIKKKQ